jgi:hypothetical protein
MTKEEFIEFIKELGFQQTWGSSSNSYNLSTDIVGMPNSNYVDFKDQLKVTIIEDSGIVELILSQMSPHMMVGKSFGNFNIKTFGDKNDFQMELFFSFIKGSFNKVPECITQYMRDKKIKDIFQ